MEQKLGRRISRRGDRTDAAGSRAVVPGQPEAQVSRAGKGEVDALAEKVHDHSVRPLEGVRLTLGELLEDLDRMGTEHAIHRDNEWMEGLTAGFTNGLILS